jgi:tetratricopeptide (TPR) repeat protein
MAAKTPHERAAEQINAGMEALMNFDFGGGYAPLAESLELLSPDDPQWPETAYAFALAAWHRSPPNNETIAGARELLEEVARRVEGTPLAAAALLDIGRIDEVADNRDDPPNPERAESYYRRVLREYPDTDSAQRAALYLAQLKVQSMGEANVREALEVMQQATDTERFPGWAGVMAYYSAHLSYFYLGDADAALAYFDTARQLGFANEATADRKLYQFSRIAEAAGRSEKANELRQQLINEYPNSIYGWTAQQQFDASLNEEIPITRGSEGP